MQLPLGKPIETERFQKLLFALHNLFSHQTPYTQHFIAVVAVGYDRNILPKTVKYGETVRGETSTAREDQRVVRVVVVLLPAMYAWRRVLLTR